MNKFYCDRCGKEIGEEKNVRRWAHSWSVCSDRAVLKYDLCAECDQEMIRAIRRCDNQQGKEQANE